MRPAAAEDRLAACGSIAGAGLLAGLILAALTRGRKRNSGWV